MTLPKEPAATGYAAGPFIFLFRSHRSLAKSSIRKDNSRNQQKAVKRYEQRHPAAHYSSELIYARNVHIILNMKQPIRRQHSKTLERIISGQQRETRKQKERNAHCGNCGFRFHKEKQGHSRRKQACHIARKQYQQIPFHKI